MSTQRFVLPRTDGSWLINPPGNHWPVLAEVNHQALSFSHQNCQGRTLSELRALTQRQIRADAVRYTSRLLGHEISAADQQKWIVTGHQPALFHPGVWSKNFAVTRTAKSSAAVGLNLIIDNDLHTGTGISVPIGSRARPETTTVLFDEARPVSPWEELSLVDRGLFRSFAGRVEKYLSPWQIAPLISDAWPEAVRYSQENNSVRLSDCLTAMRAVVERRWGAGNLEIPMSLVSRSTGFLWFTAHLLAQLPRFHPFYNSAVQDYRRRQKLRSRTHPVPDLARQDEWFEAPFWIWRPGDVVRDRLFARQRGSEIELRDRREVFLTLPLTPDRSACCAVEELARLPELGIKLRSRALTTTLFTRLFLADLFIHGIGGAKYDEMTDEMISQFYGIRVPDYATISATRNLPLGGRWNVGPQQLGETAHRLRDVQYNPERHAASFTPDEQRLVEEKGRLIAQQQEVEAKGRSHATPLTRAENRRRYERIREINHLLQPAALSEQHVFESQRLELQSQRSADRILGSRDFSWVLYPEDRLREFLTHPPLND